FWSTTEECYVCYLRTWDSHRSVSRATSKDFLHWSKSTAMTYGNTPREHLYTNQTHPYFRAPHIYLGIAARFMPGRRVLTTTQATAIRVNPRYAGDCSDAVLLTTRGGTVYDRTFMEAILRPGPGLENWVSRTNYPALGILPVRDGLAIYVQKNYGQPTAHLDRYTIRTDGFVSVRGPYSGGEMITRPVRFGPLSKGDTETRRKQGSQPVAQELVVNFATSAAGSLRVEIQDLDRKPIEGFRLADSVELVGDLVAQAVAWRGGTDLSRLGGKPVRLRFVLKDADLYSMRVR
ncbi:MAG: hypothetical protein VX951_14015, partial [Planctomycetota bacterium]|nr:hypothetical protein [Planctomycetota bacterium]